MWTRHCHLGSHSAPALTAGALPAASASFAVAAVQPAAARGLQSAPGTASSALFALVNVSDTSCIARHTSDHLGAAARCGHVYLVNLADGLASFLQYCCALYAQRLDKAARLLQGMEQRQLHTPACQLCRRICAFASSCKATTSDTSASITWRRYGRLFCQFSVLFSLSNLRQACSWLCNGCQVGTPHLGFGRSHCHCLQPP